MIGTQSLSQTTLRNNVFFSFEKLPRNPNCGDVSLSFFLEKNETKKSTSLSNRFAFKGVRDVRSVLCTIIG